MSRTKTSAHMYSLSAQRKVVFSCHCEGGTSKPFLFFLVTRRRGEVHATAGEGLVPSPQHRMPSPGREQSGGLESPAHSPGVRTGNEPGSAGLAMEDFRDRFIGHRSHENVCLAPGYFPTAMTSNGAVSPGNWTAADTCWSLNAPTVPVRKPRASACRQRFWFEFPASMNT